MSEASPGPYGAKLDDLGRSEGGWSDATLVRGVEYVSDDEFKLIGSQASWNEDFKKWDFSNFSPSEVIVARAKYLAASAP